jgi:hypothetical protein
MFLFASQTKYGVAKPGEILKAMWKSAKDNTNRSIIE